MATIISNYQELEMRADLEPAAVYALLRQHSADAFMFESVEGSEKLARYTFIGYKPLKVLKSGSYDDLATEIESLAAANELAFFHKGFVGFFSFESIADIEPKLACARYKYPHMYMQLVGTMVVFDRVASKIYLVANDFDGSFNAASLAELRALIDSVPALPPISADLSITLDQLLSSPSAIQFSSVIDQQMFTSMVEKAKQHILEGDIFQVVLSRRLDASASIDPLLAYRLLRLVNPSPYLFIYNVNNFAGEDFSLVGSSPEMLVKSVLDTQGEYQAEIRPIAGTYPRGASEEADERNARALLADEKERAEHVMLIDLARNDLGRVAEPGSVVVAQQMIIEKYSHVMHIVSSVVAKLKSCAQSLQAGLGIELLKACFPAGTLSGAPKIEAIDIITELEPEPRRSYGGAIGYFALDGSMDTAIMIRTMLIKANSIHVQAGAGIVADSSPVSEFQETYNKASALIKVANLAKQLGSKAA